jgi:hypothetical protein
MTFIVKKIASPRRVIIHRARPSSPPAPVIAAANRQPWQQ